MPRTITWCITVDIVVVEWLWAWATFTMFEATVYGRSWVRSPTGAICSSRMSFSSDPGDWYGFLIWICISFPILNVFRTLSSWGSGNYRSSAPLLCEVASHVKQLPFRSLVLLLLLLFNWFQNFSRSAAMIESAIPTMHCRCSVFYHHFAVAVRMTSSVQPKNAPDFNPTATQWIHVPSQDIEHTFR